MTATYFSVAYDNEASGPFVAEGANLTWTASVGFIVTVIDNGTTGFLICALVSGTIPTDGQTLTQGSTTADADGDGKQLLYPAYFREDTSISGAGLMAWTGPALGTTHSFFFDGQTANVVAGEILTFSGGQQCEVITVESDAGATGELSVRWITAVDALGLGLPADNDTFTGDIAGDGTLNGVVHDRAYSALHLHRLLSFLNYDASAVGNDDWDRTDAIPSQRSTDQITTLVGGVTIDDTISQHMYGGSVSQSGGDTLYSGLDVAVTSPNADTQPVLIQDDAIITDYWSNAFMPDTVAGNVRILVKTIDDGAPIDGQRVRGALLEFGDTYFFGGTTLGLATTGLALFSATDGNNQTAVGTVAGAPYNTIVLTEGFQNLDFSNGNGATPFGLSIDFGSANSAQTYERTKYIQRRGTSETLFGRNAQLFVGINTNWAYDAENAGPFQEDEILVWGTVVTYSAQTTNFNVGDVIDFAPSGAVGRLLYQNDGGATGTMVIDLTSGTPTAADTMSSPNSSGDGDVDSVTINGNAGQLLLVALDDQGTTGNVYGQLLTGRTPADNQIFYGATSNADADVQGTVATRTINTQFVGGYTGSNFNPANFGIAIDPTDAILGDQFTNLLGVNQAPPDNRTGSVTGLQIGDVVTVYPWDGSTTDANGDPVPTFGEMTLSVALTAGVSTTLSVGASNVPDNTPASGFLRVERDSDSNVELVEYSSVNETTGVFQLVGTSPVTAAISNTVMRALIDEERTTAGTSSYTAVFDSTEDVAITVLNGGSLNGPIVPFKTSAQFGAFSVGAVRTSDA